MTRALDSLMEVVGDFDAIVLDQWGVLHDGTDPYPGAISAVERLKETGVKIAVLSNSGKRADLNSARIADKGFDPGLFDLVMTSGEALWQNLKQTDAAKSLYPITAAPGDASDWAIGLSITLVEEPTKADAILLMGVPDGAEVAPLLASIGGVPGLPVYCTNPDRASPRAGGATVVSPGALAHELSQAGHPVTFYGKPHGAVFRSTAHALDVPTARILMVGDSLEHDICGGSAAGWATAFIEGGLLASEFTGTGRLATLRRLAQQESAPLPDFTLRSLA